MADDAELAQTAGEVFEVRVGAVQGEGLGLAAWTCVSVAIITGETVGSRRKGDRIDLIYAFHVFTSDFFSFLRHFVYILILELDWICTFAFCCPRYLEYHSTESTQKV